MATATEEIAAREHAIAKTTARCNWSASAWRKEDVRHRDHQVREIILITEITRIPQTPHYVKGLINLRSTVIPVIDLRIRFGLPEGDVTDESRIMVLQVAGKTIGIVVDAVSEVLRVKQDQIAPPPPTVAGLGREYLTGLVKLEKQLLILLDIDKMLGAEERNRAGGG